MSVDGETPHRLPGNDPEGGVRPGDPEKDLTKSIRTLRFLLLLVVLVTIIVIGSILFSDNSRVFLLKLTAAGLLSIIPGWIYLQFIRNKGPSLYDEYVLNLFRLEIDEIANLPAPPKHTSWYQKWHREHRRIDRGVRDNLYRRKFESVYGPSAVSTIGLVRSRPLKLRETAETFGPVVMATIVITLAWTLVLQPELLRNINILPRSFALSGKPPLPSDPLRFAFLGAYAFIILDLSRRYFRDDLKGAAYISATLRILFASSLVVAMDAANLDALVTTHQADFVAFFIGFFPRAGFTWLRGILPPPLPGLVPKLESDYPLSDLEGLNIWYESRFIEEGIESMQNLCTANLVDIMLKTRIPVARLVDWIDQAYLRLHLSNETQPLDGLRRLGIRTATDLERTCEKMKSESSREQFFQLLAGALQEDPANIDALITSMTCSLEGESNLWHVRAFRRLDWLEDAHRSSTQAAAALAVHREAREEASKNEIRLQTPETVAPEASTSSRGGP